MKTTGKTRKVYRLKDITIDSIVNYHLHSLEHGLFNTKNMPMPQCTFGNTNAVSSEMKDDAPVVKRKSLLKDKYIYLIHTILNRMFENGGAMVSLNSKVLQEVFGKDYNHMLKVLMRMNIVYSDSYYMLGEKSYAYGIYSDLPITYTMEYQGYLSKYANKMKKHLDVYKKEQEIADRDALGELYTKYNKSLKQLKLFYTDEAKQFISLHFFPSQFCKLYYEHIVDKYNMGGFSITQVDKNKRVYHIATSTPRILKPFLNIKFSADIHNSHPLLFNKVIYDYYHISSFMIERFNNLFSSLTIPPHNVNRLLRNLLINNGIKREEIKDIPTDVLTYLYLTSIGKFWDSIISEELVDKYKLQRSDVKVLMFAEVFYSKQLTTRGQFYGKQFRKKFPHVYSVIRQQKIEDRTRLANDMMKMESELFREVLMRLNQRFDVISIHDAIVVLNTPKNEECTSEFVRSEIKSVYMKNGLHPDVSIDIYGKKAMLDVLKKEADMNRKVQDYLNNLNEMANKGDENSITILQDIKNGVYDFCYNTDHSDIVLHPVDMKTFIKSKNRGPKIFQTPTSNG